MAATVMTNIVIVNRSGTCMWFQDDVAKLLAAVDAATAGVLANVPDNPYASAYRDGFTNAMRAVCAAFGLAYGDRNLES